MTQDVASILVLEGEPLISMELESILCDEKLGKPVCLTSCRAASMWLSIETPKIAILDLRLPDGGTAKLAEELAERQVPFIIHSTRKPDEIRVPEVFVGRPWLLKLASPRDLVSAFSTALGPTAEAPRRPAHLRRTG